MVKVFNKSPEARELEARARARKLGVRVAVVSHARSYVTASQSQPGVVYAIQRTPAGWACSCDGYVHTGCCKHLGAVERRSEREGWDFGAICPLHRAERYFPLDMPENVAAKRAAPAPVVVPFVPRDPAAAAARRQLLSDELYG